MLKKANQRKKPAVIEFVDRKPVANKLQGKVANEPSSILQVREIALAGQHAQAIDLATQALTKLSRSGLRTAPTQMDLLDLRAESYIALCNFDLAAKDAKVMMKLAKEGQKSRVARLQAQALNRQALVQMRTGKLKAAVKTATAAVGTLREAPLHNHLHAQSLLRLSEAQFRIRQRGRSHPCGSTARRNSTPCA